MTPQERDLITALLVRLQAQGGRPKDPEADALIRRGMSEQPDAPYLLVQTVLIQDMALNAAQGRIAELERQLAETKAAPARQPPTSFLGGAAGRGSVPSTGALSSPAPPQPSPAPSPVWTRSAAAPAANAAVVTSSSGGSFLHQAAATAAGIAGGALLFQGIQSLFGPHYGSMLSGMSAQPGISETVINNYHGDEAAPRTTEADVAPDQDYAGDQRTDFASDEGDELTDVDFAGNDDNYDV